MNDSGWLYNQQQQVRSIELRNFHLGSQYLLDNLFKGGTFSQEARDLISYIVPNGIENFLYDEILGSANNAGKNIIEISKDVYEENADKEGKISHILRWMSSPEEPGIFIKMVALYILHCRLNARLDRCRRRLYALQEYDFFLSHCIVHETMFRRREEFEKMLSGFARLGEYPNDFDYLRRTVQWNIYEVAHNCCFTYVKNNTSLYGKEIYKDHLANPLPLGCITFRLCHFEDGIINDYDEYVKYLLTKNRNGILEVTSLSSFWKSAMGVSRAKTILKARPSDLDLHRFCVALGFDRHVYQKLNELRDVKFKDTEFDNKYGIWGDNSKKRNKMIDLFLSQIDHHLIKVRGIARSQEEIPRLMMVDASIQLMQEGVAGLVKVTEDEVKRFGLSEAEIMGMMGQQGNDK